MSTPYSRRLGVAQSTGTAAATIGTVPAGKVWIVRDLIVTQNGSGSGAARVVISGVAGWVLYTAVLTQNQQHVEKERHIVLNAAESLSVAGQATVGTSVLSVQAYGYELDA